jgi:hypothetical protein
VAQTVRPEYEKMRSLAVEVIEEACDDVLEMAAQGDASKETMDALEESKADMLKDANFIASIVKDIESVWDVFDDEIEDMTVSEAEEDLEGAESVVYFTGDEEGNIEWVYSFGDPSFYSGSSEPYTGVAYLPMPDIEESDEDEDEPQTSSTTTDE